MTSYLRAIFGIGSSRSDRPKTHTRSHSVPTPQQAGRPVAPAYVYTTTPTTAVTPALVQAHPPTYPARPSPLRYNTYDDSTVKSNKSRSRSGSSGSCPRTPSGHASYKSGDKHFPFPIYTPVTSSSRGSSSRSNSNTSIYPPSSISSHSHQSHYTPAPPRTSSSGSVASRPALKQTHTWHAGQKPDGPKPHVSFVNPKRPQTLHMHPLLAASHRSRAPISYDVMFAPSSRTIVDRSTRTSVPSHTLQQPATDPPTAGRLVLRSDKFPWSVVVQAGISSVSASSQFQTPRSAAKFYLEGANSSSKGTVSNLDLIHAIHTTLYTRVTKEEWDALGAGSRAQRKVTKAYETRCRTTGGGWDQGVKRIDWLGGKTRLIGVEVDKAVSDTGVAKLVFGKP